MKNIYPNGFVVYSELCFDDTGIMLDKSSQGGFAWILRDEPFDSKSLFPNKNKIRTLIDLNTLKSYITECENFEIPISVHFIFSEIFSDSIDKELELKITNMSHFLGYDYVSPDMDYSALYEALNTDIYSKEFRDSITINQNGYFDTIEDLNTFITKRQKIINESCENISLKELGIEIKLSPSSDICEFFPIQVWDVDLNKLKEILG